MLSRLEQQQENHTCEPSRSTRSTDPSVHTVRCSSVSRPLSTAPIVVEEPARGIDVNT